MEFRLDSHTHTLASGHAYCTLLEMVRAAADRGLELICITDHAPGMELTTHKDYFLNFRVIDREIYGVRVMMGAELNVMDFDGTVDLSPKLLNNLDMAIASQHIWCMPQGGGPEENTAAMVRAMDNCPKICILGHPDDGRYPLDYPALVRAAGERGVLLEVNNTSLSPACSRVNSTANVTEMLKHCGGRAYRWWWAAMPTLSPPWAAINMPRPCWTSWTFPRSWCSTGSPPPSWPTWSAG